MQRSEGGALGIGGSNSFLSTRSQGNLLTRTTAILAAVFFLTSLGLTFLGRFHETPSSILDNVSTTTTPAPAPTQTPPAPQNQGGGAAGTGSADSVEGLMQQLGKAAETSSGAPAADAAPASGGTPAATSAAAPATPPVPSSQ
jgi:preprotein translocase subunit SecG